LADHRQQLIAKDAKVIALASQDMTEAMSTTLKLNRPGIDFSILADVNAAVSKRYGVFGLTPDLAENEPDIVSDFPSVFIIGPDRRIIWTYVGTGDTDRPKVTQIISNLP
jgi:peroxiredoxin